MNHYDTLEVHERASPEVVRAAYRSLIQRFHPDRRPDDPAAAARTAALTEAYEVLSDPARRADYDRWLAEQRAAASPAPVRPSSAAGTSRSAGSRAPGGAVRSRPAAPARPRRSGSLPWVWGLLMLLLSLSVWLMRPRPEAVDDWTALRQRFSVGGQTEQDLRELIRRRELLLQQSPALRERMAAESQRDRESRTVDLLDAPLEVVLPAGELRIPRLRLVLGSFDAVALRSYIIKNRAALLNDVVRGLRSARGNSLVGPDGERYVQGVIQDALVQSLGTRPEEAFPSTWFESPGRYGVVAVVLPDRYRLRLPGGEPLPPAES